METSGIIAMNQHVVQGADGIERRAFSAADLGRMVEAGILGPDERVELIDGELIVMNAQGFAHERLKMALGSRLIRAVPDDLFVGIEVSVQLSTRSIVQPDIVVGPDKAVARTPEGFLTIPAAELLLVIEVAASSLSFDRGRKAALYAREGVAEYWVIDVHGRRTSVHRKPGSHGYESLIEVAPDETLKPAAAELAGFSITLDALG